MFFAFFSISVDLVQNTMGSQPPQPWLPSAEMAPLAPHRRPCALCWHIKWMGNNPPSLWMYLGGGLRVCMAFKALLCSGNDASPQHWSFLRAINTLKGPNNYMSLLEKLWIIHFMHWIRAQGIIWGGHFHWRRPWSAMVVLVKVGHCRLTSDWPTVGIITIVYGSNFYSYIDPIHSWHLTWQLKKEDLDLCTLVFSWFLCPDFYGSFDDEGLRRSVWS